MRCPSLTWSPCRSLPFAWSLCWLAAWSVALCGCREKPGSSARPTGNVQTGSTLKRDHFAMALDFLKQGDEHNLDRSRAEALYYLNRWARDQTAVVDWLVDRPLLTTLPDTIRRSPATKELLSDRALAALEFQLSDVLFLEECRWLHAVANWVNQEPTSTPVRDWLKTTELAPKSARQLLTSQALFDWAVRNIQLEELRPYPKQDVAGPLAPSQGAAELADLPPPLRGVPGPGYDKYPWHILMYGRGDAYQRARIFILLARQLHIDAVMLAVDRKTGRAVEWLPAVLIEGQLYLFDAELGLPIPGPQPGSIATLAQVIADPQLLRALDIGEKYRYRIEAEDLTKIVALIDGSTEYLSQRMRLVERALPATDQMVLSLSASQQKQAVAKCAGVTDVRLWPVPLETDMYQRTRNMLLAQNPEMRWQEFVDYGVFQGLSTVVRGRRAHLLGRFEDQGEVPGANSYYMQSRMTDAQIAEIETNRSLQNSLGLEKTLGMPDREWQERLQMAKRFQVQSKEFGSYWLGLTQMEQQAFDVAINWFKTRTLESTPDGPWTAGARYNLARCYEALGRTEEARQLYLIDESPQRHGSLLRAQNLEAAK